MPKTVRARSGDCIHSISFEHGFFPDTIWELPDNSELAQLRGDPFVLEPGDEVVIPELRRRDESVGVDQRHRFRRRGVPLSVRVQLIAGDEPRANLFVDVDVHGVHHGLITDAEGWLEIPTPPNATTAVLTLESGEVYELELGRLDPPDTSAGAQGRLRTLGYYHGVIDGRPGPRMTEALQRFQLDNELEVTGEADANTQAKLQALTGS